MDSKKGHQLFWHYNVLDENVLKGNTNRRFLAKNNILTASLDSVSDECIVKIIYKLNYKLKNFEVLALGGPRQGGLRVAQSWKGRNKHEEDEHVKA